MQTIFFHLEFSLKRQITDNITGLKKMTSKISKLTK